VRTQATGRLKPSHRPAGLAPDAVCALLDALPMPAMLVAPDGHVIHANQAMRASGPEQAGTGRETLHVSIAPYGACVLVLEPGRAPVSAQTQRLAALGFMLAGVCHEVSNPLAAIHSMVQILQSRRGVSARTLEKGLASIASNIARVLDITRKVGQFSRVASDAPAAVEIDAAIDEALGLLRHSSAGGAVSVQHRRSGGLATLARPGELQQVVFNILLNAAQAMDGAGRIEVDSRPSGEAQVAIAIRDTGPGIPPEHLESVFEPFFTTKAAGQGTGLGLAITYEIVHEMNGTIRAANDPGGGARFEIVLPLYRS
jgi:signal transduction histidine kinase